MRKYRLIAEIGQGGMANVFLAVAPGPAGFNKLVVIKQLRANLAEGEEFLTMFLDEARLAARLNHPNVIHTYEVGQDEALPYLAMEYLDGQPLHRVLKRFGGDQALPLEAHLRILCDALAGLRYAHELCDYDGQPLNVVHRDVSPHNIFVTYEGTIKVVDFGIAKAMSQSVETRSGMLKGKIAYMSPEQARCDEVDLRSDLFAVGVMLWEAAARRRLWSGLSDIIVLQRLVAGPPPPSPRSVNPAVPEQIERVCMRALSHAREGRYASAAELQGELEAFLERQPGRMTSREVGKLIAERFSKEREVMHALISQQLKGASGSGPASGTGTFVLPKLETALLRTYSGAFDDLSESGQIGPPSRTNGSLVPASAFAEPPVASRVNRGLRAAVLGAFFAVSVGLGWVVARMHARPDVAASPAAGARVAPEPSEAPAAPAASAAAASAAPPRPAPADGEGAENTGQGGQRHRAAGSYRAPPPPAARPREAAPNPDQSFEAQLDQAAAAAAADANRSGKAAPSRAAPKPPPPKSPNKAKPSVTVDNDLPW
ncbi:MAG TPA: serine/threonine-protein kinase [Polyangiaceae bacterium]|nr:serine/threonine-protein kinase [Polyangiaceae bacterium]